MKFPLLERFSLQRNGHNLFFVLLLLILPTLGYLQYVWITQLSDREYDHTRSVLQLSAQQILTSYAQVLAQIREPYESHEHERESGPVRLAGQSRDSHPEPGPTLIDDDQIPFVLTRAAARFDSLRHTTLAVVTDSVSATLSYTDEDDALHTDRYYYDTHRYDSVEIISSQRRAVRGIAGPSVPELRPSDLLLHVQDSLPTRQGVNYLQRLPLDDRFVKHILDSLCDRALAEQPHIGRTYDVVIAQFLSQSQYDIFYSSTPQPMVEQPDVKIAVRLDQLLGLNGPAGVISHARPRTRDFEAAPLPADTVLRKGDWVLLIKSTKGSVLNEIRNFRQQNLSLSFGILLLLAIAIVVLIRSSLRWARLAEQQNRFFAGISHELRTPISIIRSASENISDGVISDPARLAIYSAMIRREASNLWEMVEQVLQYVAAPSTNELDLSSVNVNDLIESVMERCSTLQPKSGIRFDRIDEISVDADQAKLGMALENIVLNAMKYSGSASPIVISAQRTMLGRRREGLSIEVRDHGVGISEAEQKLLFQPFFRGAASKIRQERGNGLGLSLVEEIAKLHHGKVKVHSKLGAGTTFQLIIPIRQTR